MPGMIFRGNPKRNSMETGTEVLGENTVKVRKQIMKKFSDESL